jgi:hypothetical protein
VSLLLATLAAGSLAAATPPLRPVYSLSADIPGPLWERELRTCDSERGLLLIDGGLGFEADLALGSGPRTLTLGGGLGLLRVARTELSIPDEDGTLRVLFPTSVGWRRYLEPGASPQDVFGWSPSPGYHPFLALRAGAALGLGRGESLDVGTLFGLSAGADLGAGEVLGRVELGLEVRGALATGGYDQFSMFCPGECPCIDVAMGACGLWLGLSVGLVGTGRAWMDVLMP